MTMTSDPIPSGLNEPEPNTYPGRFILMMVLLAFGTIALQLALLVIISESPWWYPQGAVPSLIQSSDNSLLTNNSAVWQGELWVSVSKGPLPYPRSSAVAQPKSRLVAIDLKNGEVRETAITLSPAPRGIIAINNQLWCVCNSVVYQIIDNQAIPRRPRRFLNQPSNPFKYEDSLAVIDQTANNGCVLLKWDQNEWVEVGRVEVPQAAAPTPWSIPDLRVLQTSKSIFLFYSNGSAVSFREGIRFVSEPSPASAVKPDNQIQPPSPQATESVNGWVFVPVISSWNMSWDVAEINDSIRIYSNASNNTANPIQQFELRGQNWISTTPPFPPDAASFSVTEGTPGYLVTDDLRLFELRRGTFQRMTKGMPMTERLRSVLRIFQFLLGYVLASAVLTFVATRLMRRYRNSRYLYGKRTVTLASLARRAIARGIDSMIMVFPAYFWFSTIWQSQVQIQQQWVVPGMEVPILWMIFSTFGMWLGVLLVISFMQGHYGFTPGKWICGIRTLRTTLRPCGLLRSLARELVIYADSLLFLTWVPGVLLIAFTPNWQRLGDLTADTVVVLNSGSRSAERADS